MTSLSLRLFLSLNDVALPLNEGVVAVRPDAGEVGPSGVVHTVVLAAARLPPRTAVPRRVPLYGGFRAEARNLQLRGRAVQEFLWC